MPSLMAFFKRKEKAPDEPQRLDWKLLERGAIALYHKSSVLSGDIGWFRQQQYVIHELNGVGWTTTESFHTDAQRVLGFPAYYGKNLASWIDCLPELLYPTRVECCWSSGDTMFLRRRSRRSRKRFSIASNRRRGGSC